jgi:arginine utilization regulatory protein
MHSELLINSILDKTYEAIMAVNKDKIIIKCNRQMLKMLDTTLDKVMNLPVSTIMPDLDTEKEISNYEFVPLKKNLIVRTEQVSFDGAHYKILFFSDNHFNIELGNRYAEMKVLKDIYESILNSIDEGIHVADINGNVKYINPAQQKLDGFTPDIIGKHWTEAYDLDDDTSLVLKALKEAKYTYDEYQNYVTRGGKYVSIVCSAMPLYSEEKLIGAVAITKDFTKFKEIAEKFLPLEEQRAPISHEKTKKTEQSYYNFSQILGRNKLILESIRWGRSGAKSDSSVLIYGETGTGKEMFAQSIHTGSSRAERPFIAVNCAAIPENLLEGILFGTTRGAFTGAVDRIGLIELADRGTFFLDEINSMPFQLQSKLLRMVEEKNIMRLGGKTSKNIDVRVLASCNTEPSEAIEKGQLRSDLFYRLAVIYIYLPSLKERLDDLDLLTSFFIDTFNRKMNKQVASVSDEVGEIFRQYSWPGNVRELMHCLECAVNLVREDETLIRPEHLPKYLLIRMDYDSSAEKNLPVSLPYRNGIAGPAGQAAEAGIIEQIQEQEKAEIITALKRSKGNIARAAAALGLSRQRLHYRLKKYNLR